MQAIKQPSLLSLIYLFGQAETIAQARKVSHRQQG
jgi:hypothetical protein